MTREVFTIRIGVTDPVVIQCQEIDPDTRVKSAVNLTGATSPKLLLVPIDTSGTITIDDARMAVTDAANGEVTFSPDGSEFTKEAKYLGHVEVTSGAGKVISFPSDKDFLWKVIP